MRVTWSDHDHYGKLPSSVAQWDVSNTPMPHDINPEGWQRVAAAIEARAIELGWNLARLQNETRISETTRLAMRKGQPVKQAAKLAVMCKALGWTPDSVQAILDGGEPQLIDQPSADEITQRLDRLEELVGQLLQGQLDLVQGQNAGLAALDETLKQRLPAPETARRPSRRAAQ